MCCQEHHIESLRRNIRDEDRSDPKQRELGCDKGAYHMLKTK